MIQLVGFSQFPDEVFPFPWHVHQFPFPHDGTVTPCGAAITGGHYDPLGAIQNQNYTTDCSSNTPQNCEIGDLSGKFEPFPNSDPLTRQYDDRYLSLYGVNSIIGRSIVIHFTNGSRLICANIGYPSSDSETTGLLYSPFRNDFTGNIFYRQHLAGDATASVYTNLQRTVGEENSNDHNWHVHYSRLDNLGDNCSVAGPHYNPRNVNISDPRYMETCGSSNASLQMGCEIGDLSNKGDTFNVMNRRIRQFYTDTDLPLLNTESSGDSDGFSIEGRSVVIHAADRGGPRIACTNVTRYLPLEAVSVFDENGVTGSVRFYQRSPYDPTEVTVRLRGLNQLAAGYHVHEYPVGPQSVGSPLKCSNIYTGGHWNPTNVIESGDTSDQFEIGDLSGKFGSLSGLSEISATYSDPNIPLFGPFSIIGRSIVVHRPDGSRWLCSDVQRSGQVLRVVTEFQTESFTGNVTFTQPADDPYAETTIVVQIDVLEMLQPPPVVSSSSVIEDLFPSSATMATTSVAAMLSSPVVMTTSLVASISASTVNQASIATTTELIVESTSLVEEMLSPTSSVVTELPSVSSQLLQPTPTPSASSPLTSATEEGGSGNMMFTPVYFGEETASTGVLITQSVCSLIW